MARNSAGCKSAVALTRGKSGVVVGRETTAVRIASFKTETAKFARVMLGRP